MRKLLLTLVPIAAIVLIVGCSTTPTALDRAISTVQTNYAPVLALQTNIVTLVQTNTVIQTVTVTNSVGVPVPVFTTNLSTVVSYQTNLVVITNQVPSYTLTPSATATGVAGVAGTLGNIAAPGMGTLITGGLLGLLSIFLGFRNRQMNGQNDVLSQISSTLVQTIETAKELLPKAQQDAFTTWMIKNQATAGVITQVSQIVKDSTSNAEAKVAADEIMALMNSPTSPPTQTAAATSPAKV